MYRLPLQILSPFPAEHRFETKRNTRRRPSRSERRLGTRDSLAGWAMGDVRDPGFKEGNSLIPRHSKSYPLNSGNLRAWPGKRDSVCRQKVIKQKLSNLWPKRSKNPLLLNQNRIFLRTPIIFISSPLKLIYPPFDGISFAIPAAHILGDNTPISRTINFHKMAERALAIGIWFWLFFNTKVGVPGGGREHKRIGFRLIARNGSTIRSKRFVENWVDSGLLS
jgi:hypothetical protein